MQLSVELVDHIFSFLVSDRETLIACSKDPVLFPMIEKHFYHQITVVIPGYGKIDTFEPDHLFKLVSENPHILTYVRILEIEVKIYYNSESVKCFEDFAKTLLLFPKLECIILVSTQDLYIWPGFFQATLEERLNLPTVKKLVIEGGIAFPLFLLDKCKNVENLLVAGTHFMEAEGQACDAILPQLKSLTLLTSYLPPSLLLWLKPHTKELQSLKCMLLSREVSSELLEACSGLNKLDVDVSSSWCKVHVSSHSHDATLNY